MRALRHARYVPREPWRLFRDLQPSSGSHRPRGAITPRISRSVLTRVRAELAQAPELRRSPQAVPRRRSPRTLVSSMLIEQTFSVSRPPEIVFDYLANPSNVPDWQTSKTSVEQLTDGPPRVGHTRPRAHEASVRERV